MMIRHRWARCALLTSVIGAWPAAALADVLVIRSVGPSARQYPAGQRLPDNATLNLKLGDTVTVLKGTGTRVFRGPGRVSVAAAPTASRGGGGRIAAGAVRGGGPAGAPGHAMNLWQYDVSAPGRACFLAGQPLVLWRPSAETPLNLALIQAGGARTNVQWPAGQQTLALGPDQLKRTARIEYRRTGVTQPRVVTLMEITGDPGDRDALALGLVKQGCREQIETFTRIHEEKAE